MGYMHFTTENDRIEKIARLRRMGVNPYPAPAFGPDHRVEEIIKKKDALLDTHESVRIAGRILSLRKMGKSMFADIVDAGTKIQTF